MKYKKPFLIDKTELTVGHIKDLIKLVQKVRWQSDLQYKVSILLGVGIGVIGIAIILHVISHMGGLT